MYKIFVLFADYCDKIHKQSIENKTLCHKGVIKVPNIKSAKKRVIITEKKNLENRSAMSEVKTCLKKLNDAIASGDKAQATEIFKQATKLLDSAVNKGIMHINTAANKKSGFAKRINAMA